MAETNFQASSNIKVGFGSKGSNVNLGTGHATGDTWAFYPISDFNIEHISSAIDVGPSKNGLFGQLESQGKHRPDTQIYEVSMTIRPDSNAILQLTNNLFGDGSSPAALTPGTTSFPSNGASIADATGNQTAITILFQGGGSDASNTSSVLVGCYCTSMTLREDIGTAGGELLAEVTFMTAYQPIESDLVATSETHRDSGGYSIFDNTAFTLDSQPLVANSWEVTITRPLARVGYQNTTDYKPFGYVQTGPYEVTGSIVCKRDNSIEDLATKLEGDSAGITLNIAESSALIVNCPDVMIDNSKPEVGEYMLQTIPFRAFAEANGSTIISITAA